MERPVNHKNAEDAYIDAHLMACNLVAQIKGLLHDLPAPGIDASPIHWGHVGDVNHVNATLLEVVTFLQRKNA